MANLDQLNIEITASAKDAKSAIDGLTTSLQKLNNQLGLKNGAKLTQILDKLASFANSTSSALNGMSGQGLERIAKSADAATNSLKKSADQAEKFELALSKISQAQIDSGIKKAFERDIMQSMDTKNFQVPNTEKMLPAAREISNFQPPDLRTAIDQYAQLGRTMGEIPPHVRQIADNMKLLEGEVSDPNIVDSYGEWVEEFENEAEAVKNAVDDVSKATSKPIARLNIGDALSTLITLGNAFESLSKQFDGIARKGITLFKGLTAPLKMAMGEYVEKFEKMGNSLKEFQQNFKRHTDKISQFWKRTMKTFTFMLVRKAITAIIEEVNKAVQSMAMFSNAMGTQFNSSISSLVADFQYLGRSIVSVFAPLINFIAPIIDAIVSKIATLLSYIGMLFAALGGGSSFTKAKKNVGNYAKSLDKASKSAKNLTMGIDELNILAENEGGGSNPFDGWEDAWEEVDIPDWIQDIANKLKKMWEDFIRPIKAAWDKVKEYFKFAFDYMKKEVVALAKSIWDAFIQVWNEPETIEMLANMFRIIADLMIVIGNLAKNFREAWDEVVDGASRGVQIFRGIRDICSSCEACS